MRHVRCVSGSHEEHARSTRCGGPGAGADEPMRVPVDGMTALDRVIPVPSLVQIDAVDLAISPERAWQIVRRGDLGDSALVRALLGVRTLQDRMAGRAVGPLAVRIDDATSSADDPGFQVLVDDGRSVVVVGAIGKVWHLAIPFVHVPDAEAFLAFGRPGFVKVAFAIDVSPRGEGESRVTIELRVEATDIEAWAKFRRYFALVDPAAQLLLRALLSSLSHRYGTTEAKDDERALPGDELLHDAQEQVSHGITIAATAGAIWPLLVHRDDLRVGDMVPGSRAGEAGFQVLAIEPERLLVLGSLYDADMKRDEPFATARPQHFWQVTWSFELEPREGAATRLRVRARAAFPTSDRLQPEWIRPVHPLMDRARLQQLAARAEGAARDDWHDVLSGLGGASIAVAAFLTPFHRGTRCHWGLDAGLAAREYPGDELVPSPRWSWTHGIEIDAAAADVWPWLAQLGADRGGFYSYQWLENVAGYDTRNADSLHPSWTISSGDELTLLPEMPPLRVAHVEHGRFFVAHAPADGAARAAGKPWAEMSWLFFLEALGSKRSRFVSRYRCATSDDLASRVTRGPTFLEPVGFAMDRRMLLGVKARVEAAAKRSGRRATRPRPAPVH